MNTLTNKLSNTALKSFTTVLTVLLLSIQAQPAAAEVNSFEPVCKDSQRGTRCKINASYKIDHMVAQINRSFKQNSKVCSVSARGTRCLSKDNGFHLAATTNTAELLAVSSCNVTARGTRCAVRLS